jgi:predicted nucleic acid-binding protein
LILVDANVLLALINNSDDRHEAASEWVATTSDDLLVPPTVIAEVCHLVGERDRNRRAEVAFLRSFEEAGGLRLAELTPADVSRMADLTEQYADLGLGGTDASIVAIAERLGIERIATFDRRHFTVVRDAGGNAFTLLP